MDPANADSENEPLPRTVSPFGDMGLQHIRTGYKILTTLKSHAGIS